jgi:Helix-turn-helix of DDE superfamily endonuclease
MTYKSWQQLKPSDFKRRCGVSPVTFELMMSVLRPHLDRAGQRGGQCKLSPEDQLLVVLEYWREYRTQFHIGSSWGLSESAVCRLICKVENILMASNQFHLPGRRQVLEKAAQWEVIVLDVTETPIERPKKNSGNTIVARKNSIHSNLK